MHSGFVIGFASERHRLPESFRNRQSLLITGPAGSGKTTLIEAGLGQIRQDGNIIHLHNSSNLHRLLVDLGRARADIDAVFLTGGSSFVPAVRRIFESRFGMERIQTGNEFTSVARGLALRGRKM
jgi:ABC-type glutathione transport system ATPase component